MLRARSSPDESGVYRAFGEPAQAPGALESDGDDERFGDDDPWVPVEVGEEEYWIDGAVIPDGRTWRDSGFSPEDAIDWTAVGFSADESLRWLAYSFAPTEAALWVTHFHDNEFGFELTPSEASEWRDAEVDAEGAVLWVAEGFEPEEASPWISGDFQPERLRRGRSRDSTLRKLSAAR